MTTIVLVVITSLAAAPAENWPAFRGVGDSVSLATGLPLTWSKDKNVAWSIDLPGYGQSSPVVWGNRVFVTSMEGPTKERAIVQCSDLATGKARWRREFAASQKVKVSNYVSRCAPTPAVDGNRVYAFFESGDLRAFDHDGGPLWQRSLTKDYGEFKGNHGLGSSLTISRNAVIILVAHAGPSYLLAVDKATGKNLWKVDRPEKVSWTSPIVAGGKQGTAGEIFVSSSGSAAAYDAKSGKRLWQVTGVDGNTVPSATVSDELVVLGASAAGSNLAVGRGGEGDVTKSHVKWRADGVTSSFASPLIHRGCVYFTSRAGVASCLALTSGERIWQHRLGDSCWASPIGAGDRVYFFTKSGKTVVVKAGDKLEVLAENELPCDDRVYGVAAVNGAFVVRHGTELIKISVTE